MIEPDMATLITVFFTDAVVAIAMTLLILPLRTRASWTHAARAMEDALAARPDSAAIQPAPVKLHFPGEAWAATIAAGATAPPEAECPLNQVSKGA